MDLYIAYLDREHVADRLFMQGLAQALSESPSGEPPALLLHGSGEKVERTLEAEGLFPGRVDGVLDVSEPEHLDLVERAVREVNQEVVGTLTDEVVSTVGIQGDKRSLLRRSEAGELFVGGTGWIAALIKQRVLPVVSALADDAREGRVREVWTAEALTALAEAFADEFNVCAAFFTKTDRPGLAGHAPAGDDRTVSVELQEVEEGALAEALSEEDAARTVVQSGISVLLTTPVAFAAEDGPRGTVLRPPAAETSSQTL